MEGEHPLSGGGVVGSCLLVQPQQFRQPLLSQERYSSCRDMHEAAVQSSVGAISAAFPGLCRCCEALEGG